MTRALACGLAALFLSWTAACQVEPTPAESAEDYVERIATHRVERQERLRTSWLTLSGLHWLAAGDTPFGSAADNAIVFPADTSPARAGRFVYSDGTVFLEPAPGSGLTVNGEPARGGRLELVPDEDMLGLGRLEFHVIARSGQHAIRVRDPDFPAARDFDGIEFYPIDPAYVIEGRLTAPEKPRTLMVETVIGRDSEMVVRGTVEFELAGRSHRLEALGDSDDLFLLFKDGTTGKETYAAGRYLYAPVVGETVTLDFNLAYNPPCAFTPHATCPLPPSGNTIAASIEAGELKYPARQHK